MGRRRWCRRAQAARTGVRGRRHHSCRDPRQRGQQRRLGEGRLHRAWCRRACRRDRTRAGHCRRIAFGYRLCRGARNRHRARRSSRDCCVGPGVWSGRRRKCSHWHAEVQRRAPRCRSRCGGADQDGAGREARRDPREPALRHAEPEDRLRPESVLREHPASLLAGARRPAPGRCQFIRAGWDQRACDRRAGDRAAGIGPIA